MKKLLSIILLLALCLSAMLVMSSCATVQTSGGHRDNTGDKDDDEREENENEDEDELDESSDPTLGLEEYYYNMLRKDNYSVEYTRITDFNTHSSSTAICHYSTGVTCLELVSSTAGSAPKVIGPAYFKNGYAYDVEKGEAGLVSFSQGSVDIIDAFNFEILFNADNYDQVAGKENTYRLKNDVSIFIDILDYGVLYSPDLLENLEPGESVEVICTIEGGVCTFSMNIQGDYMAIEGVWKIVISRVGKTKVDASVLDGITVE